MAPQAYKSYKERIEGSVYLFVKSNSNVWEFKSQIENNDSNTSTLSKSSGNWNFGRSLGLDSDDDVWILESISDSKTFVSIYIGYWKS